MKYTYLSHKSHDADFFILRGFIKLLCMYSIDVVVKLLKI